MSDPSISADACLELRLVLPRSRSYTLSKTDSKTYLEAGAAAKAKRVARPRMLAQLRLLKTLPLRLVRILTAVAMYPAAVPASWRGASSVCATATGMVPPVLLPADTPTTDVPGSSLRPE